MSTNTNILKIIKLNLAIKMVLGYINSSTAKAQRGTTSSAQHIRPEGILRQKMYKASVILSRIRLDEYIEKT